MDTWTDTGAATLDQATRDDVYAKTQKAVINKAVVIPVYTSSAIIGAAGYVKGIAFDANSWPLFYDAWRNKK